MSQGEAEADLRARPHPFVKSLAFELDPEHSWSHDVVAGGSPTLDRLEAAIVFAIREAERQRRSTVMKPPEPGPL